VTAPVSRGQILGSIAVGRKGVTLATVPLVAGSDVAVPSVLERIAEMMSAGR
jgi:hypothetical protein